MPDMSFEKKNMEASPSPAADVAAGERVCVVIKLANGTEKEVVYDKAVPASHKIVAADLVAQIIAKLTDV